MTRPEDTNQTDLIAGYVLGDLSPEEADQLRQTLAEAPADSQAVKSFEEALALLPYALSTVEPSPHLKGKILSAATRSTTSPAAIPAASPAALPAVEPSHLKAIPSNVISIAPPRQRQWQRLIPAISTGIAAVAIAALSFNQIQLGRQSQQTVALQQQLKDTNTELMRLRSELQANQATVAVLSDPNTQVQALIGTMPNPANSRLVTARMLVKPGNRQVTLVAQNLPKLSAAQIYRLWSIADTSAAPMYCGEFRQDNSGTAQWTAPDAACTKNPAQMIITLDAPGDPITSAGPLVMKSFS